MARFSYDIQKCKIRHESVKNIPKHQRSIYEASTNQVRIKGNSRVPIPTVDSTKKTASKKIRRGDPDFLTLWLEKDAS